MDAAGTTVTRGKPDGIGKGKAGDRLMQYGVGKSDSGDRCQLQRCNRQLVRPFGMQPEQQGLSQRIYHRRAIPQKCPLRNRSVIKLQ